MFERTVNALRLVERGAVVFFFALMLVLFFINIFVRIVFPQYSSYISWAEEAARLAMIWGIFLIAGITLEQGRHIAMTTVLMQAPEKFRFMVRRVIAVSGTIFFGYFCYLAIKMTIFVFGTGQVIPSLGLSNAYLYMGAAIGLALLTVRYFVEIFRPSDPAQGQNEM